MSISNLSSFYEYLDNLCLKENNDDELFASSYIRGFIALSASDFGDESQLLSAALAEQVSSQMKASRSELTPQDQQIIANYWQELQVHFTQ